VVDAQPRLLPSGDYKIDRGSGDAPVFGLSYAGHCSAPSAAAPAPSAWADRLFFDFRNFVAPAAWLAAVLLGLGPFLMGGRW
jgi:hypothetical protein